MVQVVMVSPGDTDGVPTKEIDGKPTLVYWDLVGLVQPARLAMVYKGVDFVDVRIQAGEPSDPDHCKAWSEAKPGKLKDIMAFPNLPYMIDGTMTIAQTNAIMHHIGRKYDLMGVKGKEHMVDYIMDHLTDLEKNLVVQSYAKGPESLLKYFKNSCPLELQGFSKLLERKDFLTGDEPSVADFKLYVFLYKLKIIQADLSSPDTEWMFTADLLAFMSRMEELPNVKDYMSSSDYQKRPINNTMALWIGK